MVAARRGIVHIVAHHPRTGGVNNGPYVSGHELERVERATRVATNWGYDVAPVPDDGKVHPENGPCPICSPEGGAWLTQ